MEIASRFNEKLARTLWTPWLATGIDDWDCRVVATDIAAECGLGVFSTEAANAAAEDIRKDFKVGGRYSRELYSRLNPATCSARWAKCLLTAAILHPVAQGVYPIRCPGDHKVGKAPCIGPQRKGAWSQGGFRSAWGNTFPYGLDAAEKPCPHPNCGEPMRYWCRGKSGDKEHRWTVDHIVSHSQGGCVCDFNLRAMHAGCNSAKGNR